MRCNRSGSGPGSSIGPVLRHFSIYLDHVKTGFLVLQPIIATLQGKLKHLWAELLQSCLYHACPSYDTIYRARILLLCSSNI